VEGQFGQPILEGQLWTANFGGPSFGGSILDSQFWKAQFWAANFGGLILNQTQIGFDK